MELSGYGERGILPFGMKDILIDGSMRMEYVEGIVGDVFERWGYRRIVTSLLEYEDVLSRGIDREVRKGLLKFIEHPSGRVVTIRPDITPQVARIVATRLRDWPRPIRIYYSESVLRSVGDQFSKLDEIFQIGAELVGLSGPEADAEVVAMAVEALTALGVRDFNVTIGHVGFLRGIIDSLPAGEEEKGRILKAVNLKDRSGLVDLLSRLSIEDTHRAILSELPLLYGGREVIDKGLEAVDGLKGAVDALENLSAIWRFLELHGVDGHISIDLGEARGFHYYTGMVFEVFVKGLGRGVGRGGRYDSLLEKYGYPCPAVGFAFEVEGIMAVALISERAGRSDFFITGGEEEGAIKVASSLRGMGFRVARDLARRDYEEALAYCRRNGIAYLLDLGPEGVKVEEVGTGRKTFWKVGDLLAGRINLSTLRKG